MIDFDVLDEALDALPGGSFPHVLRYIVKTAGAQDPGAFDPAAARDGFAELSPAQRDQLMNYVSELGLLEPGSTGEAEVEADMAVRGC